MQPDEVMSIENHFQKYKLTTLPQQRRYQRKRKMRKPVKYAFGLKKNAQNKIHDHLERKNNIQSAAK